MFINDVYVIAKVVQTRHGPRIAIVGLNSCRDECPTQGIVRIITKDQLIAWAAMKVEYICIDGWRFPFFESREYAHEFWNECYPFPIYPEFDGGPISVPDLIIDAGRVVDENQRLTHQPWYELDWSLRVTR